MIFIPPTTQDTYISGLVALNIRSPLGTGDWHSSATLDSSSQSTERYVYGEQQPRNTNHLLGQLGIIDGTQRLNEMGYYPENSPVWLADHPRACVDYLYTAVLQTGTIGRVMLDEWFPSVEDKQAVYALLDKIEDHLTVTERENLYLWKRKNPII